MNLSMKGPQAIRERMMEIDARFSERLQSRAQPRRIHQPEALPGEMGSFALPTPGATGTRQSELSPLGVDTRSLTPRSEAGTELRSMIHRVAEDEQIDPYLLEALVSVESAFDSNAVSPAGAQGLTQLMPATARALGVQNPFDPEQNLRGGARYLRQMLTQFGDLTTALAAYNAGPGNVQRYGGIPPFRETQNYVRKVQERYGFLAGGVQPNAR